jgi:hypothetical protein
MELREVRDKSQFPAFFESRNLSSPREKVSFLIKEMDIRAMRSGSNMTDEEKLSTLQQYALLSWDRRPSADHAGPRF